jgi:sugar/nucleoside kinase (ribokinase family)
MELDLIVITNALTDEVYNVPNEFLQEFNLKKIENGKKLTSELEEMLEHQTMTHKSPAGSPANVGFSCATLGLNVGIVGTLGTDELALKYKSKMMRYEITNLMNVVPGDSGLCLTFVTPDGERSFWGKMNAAENHNFNWVNRRTKIVHTSGYELSSSPEKILNYLEREKNRGAKISIDLADDKSCKQLRPHIHKILKLTDILFSSLEEYSAALDNEFTSFTNHPYQHEILFMKYGSDGSEVFTNNESKYVPILNVPIKNLNGAGDAYAAGAIVTYLKNGSPLECATEGTKIAAKVIQLNGSHLPYNNI